MKNIDKMKIFVLGSSGMLGRYVSKYLSNYYNVINVGRSQLDASDMCGLSFSRFFGGVSEGDVVINCMGTIKPRVDELGVQNALIVNSLFPHKLADSCKQYGVRMIHPTTDCVFIGNKGGYTEKDEHDVTDIYGRTKSLGEPKNCTLIRTSIIGEELRTSRSLVEWVKSEKGNHIFGYTNHHWNGVTCLQFAKICSEIVSKNLFWDGCRHMFSPTSVTKKELVEIISNHYELNIKVTAKDTYEKCDRTLASDLEPIINVPELEEQIKEMKNFIL
tara:strand:+ start:6275 stop:7096 length:822 start_codon:yes stop_codon:yes gene_type:complete